jgi:hypothetical protein
MEKATIDREAAFQGLKKAMTDAEAYAYLNTLEKDFRATFKPKDEANAKYRSARVATDDAYSACGELEREYNNARNRAKFAWFTKTAD